MYALDLILKYWVKGNRVITTALLEEQDYYFDDIAPAAVIKSYVSNIDLDVELIHIALPKLYRHKPLYNVALYHELGHFLDAHYKIIKLSCLTNAVKSSAEYMHRKEYFADLFAASYTGRAISEFLSNIAPDAGDSDTHPSTSSRLKNVEDFLNGVSNENIELFKNSMMILGLPELEIRYKKPNITSAFDDIRPYKIIDEAEVHGILDAGWEMLSDAQNKSRAPWDKLDDFNIHRIVNDLVEKSIRNYMTQSKWDNAAIKS